jgi:hypothetical protein
MLFLLASRQVDLITLRLAGRFHKPAGLRLARKVHLERPIAPQ